MSGRLLFMLTLLMAISVALLSALTPLGPPSSKLTGSAFNPATTGVVLKARTQSIPSGERLALPDRGDSSPPITPGMQWLVFAMAMLVFVWGSRPLPRINIARASRVRRTISYRPHARAPPVLI